MEDSQIITKRKTKTRGLGYFNAIYGLGMLLVIVAHTTSRSIAYEDAVGLDAAFATFGNSFMVLFFFLSGFGIRTSSIKRSISFNFKTLLIPYYITALFVLLSKFGLSIIENRSFWEHGGEYILTYLLGLNVVGGGTLWGIPVQSISTLWFLWALFEARILYNLICQIKRENVILLLSGACTLLGFAMMCYSTVWPFVLDVGFMAVGWIALGDFISRYKLLDKKVPFLLTLCLLIPALYSFFFGCVQLMAGVMRNGILDLIGISCLAFLLLKVFDYLLEKFSDSKVNIILSSIGSMNIYIFCIHSYEQKILPIYRIEYLFPHNFILQVLVALAIRGTFIALVCFGIFIGKEHWRKYKHRGKKKITIELE